MKNNKGFAISVILYSLIIVICFVLVLIMSIKSTTYKTNAITTTATKNELTCASKLEALQLELTEGKQSLATAITNKGVATATTDTLTTMASNVSNIVSTTNLTLLASNKGTVTATTSNLTTYTKPAGKNILIIYSVSSNGHLLDLSITSSTGTMTTIVDNYGLAATSSTYTDIYTITSDTDSTLTFSVSINGTQNFAWQYYVFAL